MPHDDTLPPLRPRSACPGIAWPALPSNEAAVLLALQWQFDQSQWWTPEQIKRQQFRQITVLLHHAIKHVPFYTKRYQGLSLPEGDIDEAWFRQLPILQRLDVQGAGDELRTTALPPQHGKIARMQTSGSTGTPVFTYKSQLVDLFFHAATLRFHRWHEHDLSKKLAIIRHFEKTEAPPPDGKRGMGWSVPTSLTFEPGPCAMLTLKATVREQADWLVREDPDYLLTYPTNAGALAEYFLEHDLKLNNLCEVSTLSETLTPQIRELMRDAFDVPVTDMYSTIEVGYIALQAPGGGDHYLVQAELIYLEVLDDDDQPCKPGEVGRVVVTPLINFASPLIRYDVGDYARVGESSPCGRGLPVIDSIMGRTRNMMVRPNGDRVWPVYNLRKYRQYVPIKQIQMIQHSPRQIEVKLIVEKHPTASCEAELTQAIHETLGYPYELTYSYVDTIPRTKRGKFESFICEVKA